MDRWKDAKRDSIIMQLSLQINDVNSSDVRSFEAIVSQVIIGPTRLISQPGAWQRLCRSNITVAGHREHNFIGSIGEPTPKDGAVTRPTTVSLRSDKRSHYCRCSMFRRSKRKHASYVHDGEHEDSGYDMRHAMAGTEKPVS